VIKILDERYVLLPITSYVDAGREERTLERFHLGLSTHLI
jgi:hypothetical protein